MAHSLMEERRKTRIRAFRLDVGTLEKLHKVAKDANVTESVFVSMVLTDRLFADPLVRAFREIRFIDEVFQTILGGTNTDTLEMAGSEMASKTFPLMGELCRSLKQPLTFREFLTEILGKHYGWFYVEDDGSGTEPSMTLRHPFGRKWSIFIKAYILTAYSTVSKDRIKIEIAEQFVRIDFSPR